MESIEIPENHTNMNSIVIQRKWLSIWFLPLLMLQLISCSKDSNANPEDQIQPDLKLGFDTSFATFGDYQKNDDKVYVDKNLRQVDKNKAVYYLKRELLGRDIVPNDDETGNYWEDRKYFKGTPVLLFFYEYYRVDNNQLHFAVNVSELEGTTTYMFHGKALWAANDKPLAQGAYSIGELDGDFTVFNPNGSIKDQFGFDRGRKYSNMQKPEDVYKPLVGKWEAKVAQDGNFKLVTQVYELNGNGSMNFYPMTYLGGGGATAQWRPVDGELIKTLGSWKYSGQSSNSGSMEIFFKGNGILKGNVQIISPTHFKLKPVSVDEKFKNENSMNELIFQKKQ